MARTGLSRLDVKHARDSLIAQSHYPSVDAVRVALGNTGSKSTIHKYLKELEEENGAEAADGAVRNPLSDALLDLVQRLADRLQLESAEQLDQARAELAAKEAGYQQSQRQLESELRSAREAARETERRLQTELRESRLALHASQAEVTELNKEGARLVTELSHTKQTLYEQLTHARKLEQKVDQLQATERHASDLERQLASSLAREEQLQEQVSVTAAELAPIRERNRELELQLAQAQARSQAQDQIGEQVRAYLDKLAVPPPGPAAK